MTSVPDGYQWFHQITGDVLFFHYSGHGVLHEDATGELLDAYCPSDFAEVGKDPM